MQPGLIDLRSDTVTQPTEGMREAMFAAPLGDDVYGEDPSVNALQAYAAELFGKEAALFCPSGTMTNQIAIALHTQPGSEVVCEAQSHIYLYEGGGIMRTSHSSVRLLAGDRGRVTADQVAAAIQPDDVHFPQTRLVSLENTANRGGGACYELAAVEAIRGVCDAHHLPLHLDGARLFNALVARHELPGTYGALFDTLSVCLSKGLGAPVGSLLLGSATHIRQAQRLRKVLGGGWRQAGMLAAAGLYALQHHVARLADDHARARRIGAALQAAPFVDYLFPVETNIVLFRLKPGVPRAAVTEALAAQGILAGGFGGDHVRLVLHLGIGDAAVDAVVQALAGLPVAA